MADEGLFKTTDDEGWCLVDQFKGDLPQREQRETDGPQLPENNML